MTGITKVEVALARLEERMAAIQRSVDNLEKAMDNIEKKLDGMYDDFAPKNHTHSHKSWKMVVAAVSALITLAGAAATYVASIAADKPKP